MPTGKGKHSKLDLMPKPSKYILGHKVFNDIHTSNPQGSTSISKNIFFDKATNETSPYFNKLPLTPPDIDYQINDLNQMGQLDIERKLK